MVGSPCHWICEKMCTGRFVDCEPDRKRSSLISGATSRSSSRFRILTWHPGSAEAHRRLFEGGEPDQAGGDAADNIGRADHQMAAQQGPDRCLDRKPRIEQMPDGPAPRPDRF